MFRLRLRPFVLLSRSALLVFAGSAHSQSNRAYDEVKDAAGQTRPIYERAYRDYQAVSPEQLKVVSDAFLKTDFAGDNALLPLPRLIGEQEYEQILRKGVDQRARALRSFVEDLSSGKRSFEKARIIPRAVTEQLIERYQAREWLNTLDTSQMAFQYGPDIIRAPDGSFRVLEDNVGNLGLMGDLPTAHDSLLKRLPSNTEVPSRNPKGFYDALAARYKQRASEKGGIAVLVQHSGVQQVDKEYTRLRDLFQKRGVEVVVINSGTPEDGRITRRLRVRKDGVFLENSRTGSSQKVGYVAGALGGANLDSSDSALNAKKVIEEARWQIEQADLLPKHRNEIAMLIPLAEKNPEKLKELEVYLRRKSNFQHSLNRRWGVPGLFEAVRSAKVGLGSAPVVEDLLSDKQFYMYVDKLIEHYLNEKPILKNVATRSFAKYAADGKSSPDKKLVERIMRDFKSHVVKKVDGLGGDQVWVGPYAKPEELEKLKRQILSEPDKFIVQDFTPPSHLAGNIVDLRLHTEVAADSVLVSNVPAGRASSVKGDGKVNISQNGFETTVLVVPEEGSYARKLASSEAVQALAKHSQIQTELIDFEQNLNQKIQDVNVFEDITRARLPKEFDPKHGRVFDLWSVEVPEEEVALFRTGEVPEDRILVQRGTKRFVKFPVHPHSETLFRKHLSQYRWSKDLKATATSSYRSLVAWDLKNPKAKPFGVKVSLDAVIGGVRRVLKPDQIETGAAISAWTKSIDRAAWERRGVRFIDEPAGGYLKSSGLGFSIRDYPELAADRMRMPLFSFYSKDGGRAAPIVGAIQRSGLEPKAWIEEKLIAPLTRNHMRMLFEEGIDGAPHEQNVMIELSRASHQPTGTFEYRDLGGFSVHESLRKSAGKDLSFIPAGISMRSVQMKGNAFRQAGMSYLPESNFYALRKSVEEFFPEVTEKWINEAFQRQIRAALPELDIPNDARPAALNNAFKAHIATPTCVRAYSGLSL